MSLPFPEFPSPPQPEPQFRCKPPERNDRQGLFHCFHERFQLVQQRFVGHGQSFRVGLFWETRFYSSWAGLSFGLLPSAFGCLAGVLAVGVMSAPTAYFFALILAVPTST